MTKNKWIELIKEKCKKIGTYQEAFDPTISILSEILRQRDKIFSEYKKEGCHPVIQYTNKAGATNLIKNPLLLLWLDRNKTALPYWRDLGLTPSALKKIDDGAMKPRKTSISDVLSRLTDDDDE